MPRSAKYFASRPPYDVATRMPAKSPTVAADPGFAANRNVDSAKPSCRISSAGAPLSSSRSRPVMPTSSSPEPTYVAMSRGRRKKNSVSFAESSSASSRGSDRCR